MSRGLPSKREKGAPFLGSILLNGALFLTGRTRLDAPPSHGAAPHVWRRWVSSPTAEVVIDRAMTLANELLALRRARGPAVG